MYRIRNFDLKSRLQLIDLKLSRYRPYISIIDIYKNIKEVYDIQLTK